MKITKSNIEDVFRSKYCTIESAKLQGYELIENLFCDSSGFGTINEPALTKKQLVLKIQEILDDNPEVYTFLTEQGQFQVYIGVFKKNGKRLVKKVANNTTKRWENGELIIRLHNTDILKFKDGAVVLNSGGYKTQTTKGRINQFLLPGYWVEQKNYEWILHTPEGTIDFYDGLEVPLNGYVPGQEQS